MRKVLLSAALALGACGAPNKKADQVGRIFDGPSRDLQGKVDALCAELRERAEAPTLQGMRLGASGCSDAGVAALNLSEIKAFAFEGLEERAEADDEDLIAKDLRTQVWLNRSLVGLAAAVAQKMSSNPAAGALPFRPSEATAGLSGLVTPQIELLETPTFDARAMRFSALIRFRLTGAVTIDNTIEVAGALLDNRIAVTIRSRDRPTFEQSLLRDLEAVIFIVPHASDVYLDVMVGITAYDPGVGNVLRDQLGTFLGTGMKTVIDGVLAL